MNRRDEEQIRRAAKLLELGFWIAVGVVLLVSIAMWVWK